ncbi:hypothetical protein O9993_01680 [Vibrio lentus]|nr:hypothetical protein [Vibrio lentus]
MPILHVFFKKKGEAMLAAVPKGNRIIRSISQVKMGYYSLLALIKSWKLDGRDVSILIEGPGISPCMQSSSGSKLVFVSTDLTSPIGTRYHG